MTGNVIEQRARHKGGEGGAGCGAAAPLHDCADPGAGLCSNKVAKTHLKGQDLQSSELGHSLDAAAAHNVVPNIHRCLGERLHREMQPLQW